MSNGTKLALTDEQKVNLLAAAARRLENSKGNPKEYAAASKDLVKVAQNIGLTEAQASALGKYIEQPGEVAALVIKTMINLAEKNATVLIELKKQWADAYMRQGNSIAGIASAARAIGSICAMFGAEDFANTLNEKADAEMLKAEIQFAKARQKMEEDTGATAAMRKSMTEALSMLTDQTPGNNIAEITAKLVQNAARAPILDVQGTEGTIPAAAPSKEATRSQGVSWKQFHENMASVGIDADAQAIMRKIFDKDASYIKTSKAGVIDNVVEGDKLVKDINKSDALTPAQKKDLVSALHTKAPEFIPGWAG